MRTWQQFFPHAEVDITAICCAYLSFEVFLGGPCKTNEEYEKRLQENPLFEYAAESRGFHAVKAGILCEQVTKFHGPTPRSKRPARHCLSTVE